jgi:hypothetical protein
MIENPYLGAVASLALVAGLVAVTTGMKPAGYLLLICAIPLLAGNALSNYVARRNVA